MGTCFLLACFLLHTLCSDGINAKWTVSLLETPIDGKSVVLECSYFGSNIETPGTSFKWKKMDKTIGNRSNRFNMTGPLLVINSVRKGDRQTPFSCSSSSGDWSEPFSIAVEYEPGKVKFDPKGATRKVVEGNSLVYRCSVDCNPPCQMRWLRDNKSVSVGDRGVLNITNISRDDVGEFVCEVFNKYGRNAKRLNLVVEYPPAIITFDVESTIAVISEGKDLTRICHVDCRPECQVQWFKDGEIVPESLDGKLVIRKISRQSAGSYDCRANNSHGGRSRSLIVEVNYGPGIVNITPHGSNVTATKGKAFGATCEVECHPKCSVQWFKDDDFLPGTETGKLAISHIKRMDRGVYMCVVNNSQGVKEKSMSVNVEYGPETVKIEPHGSQAALAEGEHLVASCEVDCNPPCTVQWFKEGNRLSETKQLSIPHIRSSGRGVYKCKANNSVEVRWKSLSVDVEFGPRSINIVPYESNLTVSEGESLVALCKMECKPACAAWWFKDDKRVPGTENGNLNITGITRTDGGAYTCKVNNSHGEESHTINVVVEYISGPMHSETTMMPFNITGPNHSDSTMMPLILVVVAVSIPVAFLFLLGLVYLIINGRCKRILRVATVLPIKAAEEEKGVYETVDMNSLWKSVPSLENLYMTLQKTEPSTPDEKTAFV